MQKIKTLVLTFALAMASLMSPLAAATPGVQFGAVCPSGGVLNFPAWYDGLQCEGTQPKLTKLSDFWVVALNVVAMLIALVSYMSLGYVIWGGFKYIKSQGQANAIGEAKMAIIQAVAGLAIALSSFAIIRFVQGLL